MLRGLLAGGFWGAVVGGTGLTVASLVTEQPAGNAPPEPPQVSAPEAVDVLEPFETPVASPDIAPTMTAPEVDTSSGLAAEATTDAVAQPDVETPAIADTESAAVPETANVDETLSAPDAAASLPEDPAPEDPVLPNPQSIAPQVPAAEQDIDVSTAPADAPDPIVVAVPAPEVAPARTLDIPVPQPAAPDAVVIDDPAPEVPDVVVAEPEVAAPAGLPSGDGAVAVNRLGGQAAPAEAAAEKRPALEQFAAVYTGDDAKLLMGILLLDDGSMDGGPPAIASLPFGVTVVLDPAMEGATARMAEYRAAGIEVGVRSQLPDGATPADVEVTLESTFKTLPETVLLLDAGDGGLQNDRAVTAQAMERLAQDGRGLVTVSKGLNMAMRAAEQAEVPASVIFRDLDAEGQDARVIRRSMDQAAFRARQNSGVLLLARVRPDTISALVLWGTANRSGQVALAPVSAILKAQGE